MPSMKKMKDSGRPDLAYAVARWGGVTAAAEIAGLPMKRAGLIASCHALIHLAALLSIWPLRSISGLPKSALLTGPASAYPLRH